MQRKILNKWQFHFNIQKHFWSRELGWYELSFAIFKYIKLPPEGFRVQRADYKGFRLHFYFWLPIYT